MISGVFNEWMIEGIELLMRFSVSVCNDGANAEINEMKCVRYV